ncbi:hypothetical protein MINTMi27_15580 [Mycobacterium intracellulare]|nr:hypothetical protein MINTMi27_15580 [Mycobacterium intracellulare]
MSGRHRKPEEDQTPAAFEDVVQGLELSNEVLCEACEKREPFLRVKPCGEEEYSLLCPLCLQAIFLSMSLAVAQAMCEGTLTVCGPCNRPIPDVPSLREHVEVIPVGQRGLDAA